MVRPKFYGERDILVAEGDRGKGKCPPSVPPQLDLRFWGDGTSLYGGSSWHFFRRLDSKAAQPFSPAVVINRQKVARPHTG